MSPHPMTDVPGPFDQRRLEYMGCPKCGHQGKPNARYREAETVYSACDLHFPERITLQCNGCGHEEWMRPKDYSPPPLKATPPYVLPWWKMFFVP